MKYINKKTGVQEEPLITSSDISVHNIPNINNVSTLNSLLTLQQEDIQSLKSNVKWLYTYGGVGSGSGSGSGGGSFREWLLYITVSNIDGSEPQVISNGTILRYTSKVTKKINIHINYHNNSIYTLKYNVNGLTNTKPILINASNTIPYEYEFIATFEGNNSTGLLLSVTNTDDGTKKDFTAGWKTVQAVCTSRLLKQKISNPSEVESMGENFLLGQNEGYRPIIRIEWNIYVDDITSICLGAYTSPQIGDFYTSYNLLESASTGNFQEIQNNEISKNYTISNKRNGYADIIIPKEFLTDDNSNTYIILPIVKYISEDSTQTEVNQADLTKTFSIIPQNIYLLIFSSSLRDFYTANNPTTADFENLKETTPQLQGTRTFRFKIFDGRIQETSTSYTVNISRTRYIKDLETGEYKEQPETLISDTLHVSKAQILSSTYSLNYNQEGLWKTSFKVYSLTTPGTLYVKDIYMYVSTKNLDGIIQWYKNTDVNKSDSTAFVISSQAFLRPGASGYQIRNFAVPSELQGQTYLKSPFVLEDNSSYTYPKKDVTYNLNGFNYLETAKTQKHTYLLTFPDIDVPERATTIVSIGFQYSDINSTDSNTGKILNIYGASLDVHNKYYINKDSKKTLSKYRFLSDSDTICLPAENYDPTNKLKYHLFQYIRTYIPGSYDSQTNTTANGKYAEYVYIDGKLEDANTDFNDGIFTPFAIELFSLQVSYNLIDVAVTSLETSERAGAKIKITTDDAAFRYYAAFKQQCKEEKISNLDKILLDEISKYIYFDGQSVNICHDQMNPDNKSYDPRIASVVSYGSSYSGNSSAIPGAFQYLQKIALNSEIPILFLDVSSENEEVKKSLSLWEAICSSTLDDDKLLSSSSDRGYCVDVFYSPGGQELVKQALSSTQWEYKSEIGEIKYYLDIQGTSTRNNRSKNFSLSAYKTVSDDSQARISFSPNYDPSDNSTFLPETKWTLKADVSDSGHSNNTSIGKFINLLCRSVTPTYFDNTGTEHSILTDPHLKVCLEGFPCLVFLSDYILKKDAFNGTEVENQVYFLGYYNFNLGRDSNNNLGYTSEENFQNLKKSLYIPQSPGEYFTYGYASGGTTEGLGVTEITTNEAYFDFSQYLDDLLFEKEKNSGAESSKPRMYGSFVPEASNKLTENLKRLNLQLSRAGYFIFKKLNKSFVGDEVIPRNEYNEPISLEKVKTTLNDAYKMPGVVNTPLVQYTITSTVDGEGKTSEDYYPTVSDEDYSNVNINDVIELLCSCKLSGEGIEPNVPYLNYKYAVIYYVVVMAFGMVDSVLKNLNMKSWNVFSLFIRATFLPEFYDMDTGLELNNRGAEQILFNAAMDYWSSKTDANGILLQCNVVRDYWPKSLSNVGFDFPSSYLFGVVKYSYAIIKQLLFGNNSPSAIRIKNELAFTPQILWAKLRGLPVTENSDSITGMLRNYSYFMEHYYSDKFEKVPGILISLNYKLKYLYYQNTGDTAFKHLNKVAFHGTRRLRVKEWLQARLYFLDSIFNISSRELEISKNDNIVFYEPLGQEIIDGVFNQEDKLAVSRNNDISILRDAFTNIAENGEFSSNPSRHAIPAKVRITAPQNSPLEVRNDRNISKYFLCSDNVPSEINFQPPNGGVMIIYGSKLWSDVSSINPFTYSQTYVDSDNLQSVICDVDARIESCTISGRKISTISFTGNDKRQANYDFNLTYNKDNSGNLINMLSLESINIARTAINLNLQSLPTLKKINVTGNAPKKGASINNFNLSISGCLYLEEIQFEDNRYYFDSTSEISTYDTVEIYNYHGSIYMSRVNCKNIIVSVDEPNLTAYISNNNSLEQVTLYGFKTVVITKCENLKLVKIIDTSVQKCECLQVLQLVPANSPETATPIHIWGLKQYSNAAEPLYNEADQDFNNSITLTSDPLNISSYSSYCNLSKLSALQQISLTGYRGIEIILPPHDIFLKDLQDTERYYVNRHNYNVYRDEKNNIISSSEYTSQEPVLCGASETFNNCSNLQKITFATYKQSLGLDVIKLGNVWVENTTELSEPSLNPVLYICGSGVFLGCSNFTATDTNENIIFSIGYKDPEDESKDIPVYSMANMFAGTKISVKTIGKLFARPEEGDTFEPVIKFAEALTDLSGCFAGCPNVNYSTHTYTDTADYYKGNPLIGGRVYPEFYKYPNVNNISGIFRKCENITYVGPELLDFRGNPDEPFNLTDFITKEQVSIYYEYKTDNTTNETYLKTSFSQVAPRLSIFYSEREQSKITFTLLHSSTEAWGSAEILLKDFLGQFTNIRTFGYFDISTYNNLQINCENAFEGLHHLTSLNKLFNQMPASSFININSLFKTSENNEYTIAKDGVNYVKNLTRILNSFQSYGLPQESIILKEFYPWEQQFNSLPSSYTLEIMNSAGSNNFIAWNRKLRIMESGGNIINEYRWWFEILKLYKTKMSSYSGHFMNCSIFIDLQYNDNLDKYNLAVHPINGYQFNVLFKENSETLFNPDLENEYKFSYFFYNFKTYLKSNDTQKYDEIPVAFWNSDASATVFDWFKSAEDISYMFYNVFLADMPPADFFRKRQKELIGTGFVHFIANPDSLYNLSVDNTGKLLNTANVVGGTLWTYNKKIGNMQSTFENCTFPVTNHSWKWLKDGLQNIEDNKIIIEDNNDNITLENDDIPEYIYSVQQSSDSESQTSAVGSLVTVTTGSETEEFLTSHITIPSEYSSMKEMVDTLGNTNWNVGISEDTGLVFLERGSQQYYLNKGIFTDPVIHEEVKVLKNAFTNTNNNELNDLITHKYLASLDYDGVLTFEKYYDETNKNYSLLTSTGCKIKLDYNFYTATSKLSPRKKYIVDVIWNSVYRVFLIQLYVYITPKTNVTVNVLARTYISETKKVGRSQVYRNISRRTSYTEQILADVEISGSNNISNFVNNPDITNNINTVSYSLFSDSELSGIIKTKTIISNDDKKHFTNLELNNDNQEAYPFCTPDIFAACPATATEGQLNISSVSKGINLENTIANWNTCGFIPDEFIYHLNNGTVIITGLYNSVKILPQYHSTKTVLRNHVKIKKGSYIDINETGSYFYFIPNNYTQITADISNKHIFDFNIMLPKASTYVQGDPYQFTKDIFFIFDTKAINWSQYKSTAGLLPSIWGGTFITQDNNGYSMEVEVNGSTLIATAGSNQDWAYALLHKFIHDGWYLTGTANTPTNKMPQAAHVRLVLPSYNYEDEDFCGLPIYYQRDTVMLSSTIGPEMISIIEGRIFADQDFANIDTRNIRNFNHPQLEPIPVISTTAQSGFFSPTVLLPSLGKELPSGKSYLVNKKFISEQSSLNKFGVKFDIVSSLNGIAAGSNILKYLESMSYDFTADPVINT